MLAVFSISQVMKYSILTHSYVLDKYSNKYSSPINTDLLYRPQATRTNTPDYIMYLILCWEITGFPCIDLRLINRDRYMIHDTTNYLIITIAAFSDAKTLTFSTMIKKTQLYKIIDNKKYKKWEHLN